ncbi:MAG TPA: hypothetical protein RMH99_29940 [Sandaracinaceae bacterium LLY-WYZ-13_1]|nr:hypothetical protein [Sandaracinaceae bacterium LLY-WYZ-13_1]
MRGDENVSVTHHGWRPGGSAGGTDPLSARRFLEDTPAGWS